MMLRKRKLGCGAYSGLLESHGSQVISGVLPRCATERSCCSDGAPSCQSEYHITMLAC